MIHVEEDGLGEVESAEDVPKSSCIQRVDAVAYTEERLVHLIRILDDNLEAGDLDAKEDREHQ